MKAKYLVIIGLLAATFAACSRDEESLFEKPAAIRAQEAIENAFDVLTAPANGWEMAYFPNLEASAKGYNMVLKFNKNGNVSVTAKNGTTTMNKIMTDTASTWAVKSDYGPILTFDTYNDVFHAFSDPKGDGAGLLGDYEFLILKATPELVLLKGKKHSAYSVMRPMKNTDLPAYFAACEKMQTKLFGNNNIVTLHQGDKKMYLYKGADGQFQSAAYGSPLVAEAATYHPLCATEDGIIVSMGFGEDIHDHIFYYDSIKGELKSDMGAVMNAGNLNVLFGAFFTDNAFGWAVDPAGQEVVEELLAAVNKAMKNTSAKMKVMGYGYKQSLNMYEGGYFHTRGIYRSEATSCMNNNIPYYSAISRQEMVERIMRYAGKEFSLEDFYARDVRDASNNGINTASAKLFVEDNAITWNGASKQMPPKYMGDKPQLKKSNK